MQDKKERQESWEGVSNCGGPSGSGRAAQRGREVRGTNHPIERERPSSQEQSMTGLCDELREQRVVEGRGTEGGDVR